MIIPGLTMKIYRDGSQALMDQSYPPRPNNPKGFHTRTLFDLQAQKSYTWDLIDTSIPCGPSTFSGDWGDPFQASAEMTADLAKQNPKVLGKETVNGIATKVLDVTDPKGQGKVKLWLDEQYGLIVKWVMVPTGGQAQTFLEVKELSLAKPSPTLFVLPPVCAKAPTIGHTSSRAGRVTAMTLTAQPAKYIGPCPGRIAFTGTITTDGPTEVPYVYHSSMKHANGQERQWPGGILTFAAAGTQSVNKTITFVGDGPHISAWIDIGTSKPNPAHSKVVPFTVECSSAN